MKRRKLTQQEKGEKDFQQFSNALLRMLAQAYENPKQLRRVKAWYGFIGTAIEELGKKEEQNARKSN